MDGWSENPILYLLVCDDEFWNLHLDVVHCELDFTLNVIVMEKVIPLVHHESLQLYILEFCAYEEHGVSAKSNPWRILASQLSRMQDSTWFLQVPIDHVYENLQKFLNAGVIGITGNNVTLERWLVTSRGIVSSTLQFKMETNIHNISEKAISTMKMEPPLNGTFFLDMWQIFSVRNVRCSRINITPFTFYIQIQH